MTNGPISSSPSAVAAAKAAIASTVSADRAREGGVAFLGLEAREVWQQRGLDRLEELQRRARDQHDVEDDPGERAVGGGRVDGQDGGVQQHLLGEHDSGDPQREAPAAAQRELGVGGLLDALGAGAGERGGGLVDGERGELGRWRAVGRGARLSVGEAGSSAPPTLSLPTPRSCPRRANAAGTTTSESSGAAAMPSATAVWPLAMPIATASAKQMREVDSIRTSPP